MHPDFKNIHIGEIIHLKVKESKIDSTRICNFMKCTELEVGKMYLQENLPTHILLRWSKLLEYDFFRLYSQHLILYAPPFSTRDVHTSQLPHFRKNIYTQELTDFILEMIRTGLKTKRQVIEEYGIPHTTVYKWSANESQETVNTRLTKDSPMKKNDPPHYKRIYSDIIDQKFPQKKAQCERLLGKKTLSALDILELNRRIFGTHDKEANVMNQKLRSYGKSDIIYILDYQRKHGMSNLQLALHFGLSRNTITTWKRKLK